MLWMWSGRMTMAARLTSADSYALGLLPSPIYRSNLKGVQLDFATDDTDELLPVQYLSGDLSDQLGAPSSYDLRTLGKLTAIRDQGSSGSCWAFASIAFVKFAANPEPQESWPKSSVKS